ncbi:peroxisomal targeting signal 2 receptor [Savitreella phatthalungensis]
MFRYRTTGFNGSSIAFSPYYDNQIAVSSSANYGLVGNGRLHVLTLAPGGMQVLKQFDTQDGLFDVAWSENHENQLAVASGDGTVQLFDTSVPSNFPIRKWREHTKEVFSVSWNLVAKDTFCSSSWDGSIKIWHPQQQGSVATLIGHRGCVYQAAYSPRQPNVIASVAADGQLCLWDPTQGQTPVLSHPVSSTETLALAFNKYAPHEIYTAGVDLLVNKWDTRMLQRPLRVLRGHKYAIKKLASSPFDPEMVSSASYDMTTRVWRGDTCVKVFDAHTEFVAGLDWSVFGVTPGFIATVGWDENVFVWKV